MFDGVGKVLERTDRDGLLRRILRRGVRLGETWNHYLNVALRAERPGLQQRLVIVDTPPVHVHAYAERKPTPQFTNNTKTFVRFSSTAVFLNQLLLLQKQRRTRLTASFPGQPGKNHSGFQ